MKCFSCFGEQSQPEMLSASQPESFPWAALVGLNPVIFSLLETKIDGVFRNLSLK